MEYTDIMRWWASLEHHTGDRANLRRCHTVNDVQLEPAYHKLLAILDNPYINHDQLAVMAGVLSHITTNNERSSTATQLAECMSELRFRRLLSVNEPDDLMLAMIRAVAMLKGSTYIIDIANAAYSWDDETKKAWALDYFSAGGKKHD